MLVISARLVETISWSAACQNLRCILTPHIVSPIVLRRIIQRLSVVPVSHLVLAYSLVMVCFKGIITLVLRHGRIDLEREPIVLQT